jgi:hypothetical protein
MKALGLLFLISAGLIAMGARSIDQGAFFIPIPAAFAPVTKFGCPDVGTIFTYNVPAWNTNRPNRMVAIEQDQYNCRIRSDAQGIYDWFGGLGAHLDDGDVAEKRLISDLWPLRSGSIGRTSKYDLPPSRYGEIDYVVSYGLARVPAGLFWAYKIRKDYYWQNKLYRTTTLWWSPSLKWTILQWPEEPGKVSQVGGFNWELLSVSSE